MPDLRAQIADALAGHDHWDYAGDLQCRCGESFYGDGDGDKKAQEWGAHAADVVLALPGVAVVGLPEQMTDRSNVADSIKDRPMWEVGGSWTSLTDNAGEIEFETDNQNACGCLNTPDDARALAAALLAAANSAEAVER